MNKIKIPIYYYEDEDGNRMYDYEGMADEFEQELSMLDQDVKVVVSVEDKPNRNESTRDLIPSIGFNGVW